MHDTNWTAVLNRIRVELSDLANYVDNARKGIENLESTVKISTEKFPEASKHLSSITGDLEAAANNIISILEGMVAEEERTAALLKELSGLSNEVSDRGRARFGAIVAGLSAINAKGRADTMNIFTFLAFHDLSGQKLKKVMEALATVEKKVSDLAHSFGFEEAEAAKQPSLAKEHGADASKVNQDTIDQIMKQMGGRSSAT